MYYNTKRKYSNNELKKLLIKDLISDIRFTKRLIDANQNVSENKKYLTETYNQVIELFFNRHTVKLNHCGWPMGLKTL